MHGHRRGLWTNQGVLVSSTAKERNKPKQCQNSYSRMCCTAQHLHRWGIYSFTKNGFVDRPCNWIKKETEHS